MSNISINTIKGIFTRAQKETLNTQDGKRNLYFDYTRNTYIKFALDVATTCESIFRIHKNEIKSKLQKLYNKDVNLEDFGFVIVELNANKYDSRRNLINVKLRLDDNIIFRVLMNSQLMICYLKITNHNIILKKNVRNFSLLNPLNYNMFNTLEKPEGKKKPNNIKIYYPKNNVHYYNYNAYSFSKEKITISEEEIYITSKPEIRLSIREIKSISSFICKGDADDNINLKNYKIYGDVPVYCIEIEPKDKKKILMGKNKYDHYLILLKAINAALINYQNLYCDFNLKNKIIQNDMKLFSIFNDILRNFSSLEDLVVNKSKRMILFRDFKERELANIIDNIMNYKSNFNKGRLINSIYHIQILTHIIDKIIKEKKYLDIINEENTKNFIDIWDRINEIFELGNEINKTNENLDIKENNNININKNSEENNNNINDTSKNNLDVITNDNIKGDNEEDFIKKISIKFKEEKIKELKNIININTFDHLYLEIMEKYLSPYYNIINESEETKNKINSNIKLILGNCFIKCFEMKKEKDFHFIGGDELEKTIDDFNNQLIFERENNSRVI